MTKIEIDAAIEATKLQLAVLEAVVPNAAEVEEVGLLPVIGPQMDSISIADRIQALPVTEAEITAVFDGLDNAIRTESRRAGLLNRGTAFLGMIRGAVTQVIAL